MEDQRGTHRLDLGPGSVPKQSGRPAKGRDRGCLKKRTEMKEPQKDSAEYRDSSKHVVSLLVPCQSESRFVA